MEEKNIELTLSFDDNSPLYRQLYNHIRFLIQHGILTDGMKLPSIRSLVQQLHISKTTVETAYHMLVEEGYVISKERSGLIVVHSYQAFPTNNSDSFINKIEENKLDIKSKNTHENIIDFSLLTIDVDSFPLRLWKSVIGESLTLHNQSFHEYGDAQGEYPLRESLAQYLHNSRGVICSPEQIVIGSGISYSIQLLSRLLGENISVGIEKSGIAQVRNIFTQNRFEIVPVSLDRHDELEQELDSKKIRLLYVTPSHRPTGEALPYTIRQQMLKWAYENNSYLIEDDYDGELRLSGKPLPSLQGLDKNDAVIYIGSFSKVFTPALRLNYMVLPQHLLTKLKSLNQILSCPSRSNQWAMQLFISRGHWYRHLRRMRKIYRLKHDTLVQIISHNMPDSVQINSSGSGLHIELSIDTNVSVEKLIELARNEGVLVYGSQDPQLPSNSSKPNIYLGFGGIKEGEMVLGVQLLKKAWFSVLNQ